ncbi:hypothetical protein GGQ84_001107 [Desulfitispora alkaliphila]|uniref:capping complex subunit for YIEGIA n=1 Tax=Desulfitispora alkaliphila TaxID=622674 RepID=UPI003D1D50B6
MTEITGSILAVITKKKDKIYGGAPIFVVESDEEQQRLALYFSRILRGMAHDLENGTYIIVRH